MIPNWLKMVVIAVGIVGACVAAAGAGTPQYEQRVFRELSYFDGQLMTRPLPPFKLYDLNGQVLDMGALQGKVLFLNLWASWCRPCRDELPSMVRLAESLAPEGDAFAMIAVSWDEDHEELLAFLRGLPQVPNSMIVAVDPGGELTRQLGTRLLPETYIVDADSQIVARFQNTRNWDDEHAVRLITTLIRNAR